MLGLSTTPASSHWAAAIAGCSVGLPAVPGSGVSGQFSGAGLHLPRS